MSSASANNPRITMRLQTNLFFDRAGVQKSSNLAKIDVLRSAGASIREIARKSMKYKPIRKRKVATKRSKGRKRAPLRSSSPAGTPPFRHVRLSQFGIHKIQFYKDPKKDSVIVGPITNRVRTKPPTETLEYGGTSPIRGQRRKRTSGAIGARPIKAARVARRPYMDPALRKIQPTMAASYAEALQSRARKQRWKPIKIYSNTTKVVI